MKLRVRTLAWLLPFLLTACFHKTKQPPAQALPPPTGTVSKPEPTRVELPPSALTLPTQPLETAPVPEKSKPRAKRKESAKKAAPPPAAQQAAIPNPGVSAIGQLSSGDSSDLRQQTESAIAAAERKLNRLNRKLNDQEQKTAAHIRVYLKQAREALASGDVEGARTLVAKVKVLLNELN